MLGRKSDMAETCRGEGFIGTDFDIKEDLTGQFSEDLLTFNETWIDKLLPTRKNKISARLAGGALWTVSKGIRVGDIVLCPTASSGELQAGDVVGEYEYVKEGPLPQCRRVHWYPRVVYRDSLSPGGLDR